VSLAIVAPPFERSCSPRQIRKVIQGADLARVSRALTFTWSFVVFRRRPRSVQTTLTEGF
jgi:hypothetical protein